MQLLPLSAPPPAPQRRYSSHCCCCDTSCPHLRHPPNPTRTLPPPAPPALQPHAVCRSHALPQSRFAHPPPLIPPAFVARRLQVGSSLQSRPGKTHPRPPPPHPVCGPAGPPGRQQAARGRSGGAWERRSTRGPCALRGRAAHEQGGSRLRGIRCTLRDDAVRQCESVAVNGANPNQPELKPLAVVHASRPAGSRSAVPPSYIICCSPAPQRPLAPILATIL